MTTWTGVRWTVVVLLIVASIFATAIHACEMLLVAVIVKP